MIETLYLVIECRNNYFRTPRIAMVTKRKPMLKRPSEQALVKLQINLPDGVMNPREVRVEINPEHIVAPTVTAASSPVS